MKLWIIYEFCSDYEKKEQKLSLFCNNFAYKKFKNPFQILVYKQMLVLKTNNKKINKIKSKQNGKEGNFDYWMFDEFQNYILIWSWT